MENQNDIPQQETQNSAEPAVATVTPEAPTESLAQESAEMATDGDQQSEAPEEESYPQSNSEESMVDTLEPRISDSPSAKVLTEDESIQRAKFPPLDNTMTTQALGKIEYLKDVDLDASVELGNTVLTVEKILNLNVGSIIELNQTIGDQVKLLINGNPYACGEVVVIGDKFGVRITKLLH